MAKPKSKEFVLKEQDETLDLYYLNRHRVEIPRPVYMCPKIFKRFFGFGVEPGKSKRIRITIEPLD